MLAGLALAGCVTRLPVREAAKPKLPPVRFAAEPFEELEPVLAVTPGPYDITVRMASNGCTARPDVAVYVERKGEEARLAFGRRRLDLCGARGAAVDLRYSWSELALPPGTPLVLLNPRAPAQDGGTAPPGDR